MSNAKDNHDKKVEDVLEKVRGLGKTEGYEWVIKTTERLLGDGSGQKQVTDEQIKERLIKVGIFKTEPARVTVQKGITCNLGNYESARVTVGFEAPCYVEEVREVEAVLNDLVEARIGKEVLDIRGKDIRPGMEAKRQEVATG